MIHRELTESSCHNSSLIGMVLLPSCHISLCLANWNRSFYIMLSVWSGAYSLFGHVSSSKRLRTHRDDAKFKFNLMAAVRACYLCGHVIHFHFIFSFRGLFTCFRPRFICYHFMSAHTHTTHTNNDPWTVCCVHSIRLLEANIGPSAMCVPFSN